MVPSIPLRDPADTQISDEQAIMPGEIRVIKRDGSIVAYDDSKIAIAIRKAYIEVEGQQVVASSRVRELIDNLTGQISATFERRMPSGGTIHIEEIQDQVELALMRSEEHKIARSYVIYRERRAEIRRIWQAQTKGVRPQARLRIRTTDGASIPLDMDRMRQLIEDSCHGVEGVDPDRVFRTAQGSLYDNITTTDLYAALIISTRALIEEECNYGFVTARLLLNQLCEEALQFLWNDREASFLVSMRYGMADLYPKFFKAFMKKAVALELLSPELLKFDLDRLGLALHPGRDLQFNYLGLQTLYDRYLIHSGSTRFELPQVFFMRVAMGLSKEEADYNDRAIEFYEVLSSFRYMSSTPTLFNSGTLHSQLSSCYLLTVPDDLDGIYEAIKDNAMLSKWAGGLGNDWTRVRALGSHIKGTNGQSQGIVPFLKVVNDTAVAVNQGGKRKGAVCCYLETWHLDIEEFLELRKNTGDDRRRTHDMNTANWVPDLFMKRVAEDAHWTLFSPDTTPDLHDLYGQRFDRRYEEYERMTETGEITLFKKLRAQDLWRRMLTMLFETGHPWITFKDACNQRSPQQHMGVVHSSNLCTEITLNTSDEEIAVCNLGSINLGVHLDSSGDLDVRRLGTTVRSAIRMLDNVIDINYYSVDKARCSNLKHRPIGLGIMGFQEALHIKRIPYGSQEAVEFADASMEAISYFAIDASSDLAVERGCYETYEGSLWSQGILPIDSLDLLQRERGEQYMRVDRSRRLDWDALRTKIAATGMRNSNVLAIAPTATIANIVGVPQSIEPVYQNLYVKSNLSGEFTIVNPRLVRDLQQLNLWDSVMINDLKYYNGSLQAIERIPNALKELYATAFEIEPKWLVEAASRRQKWIDQAQSLNLYMADTSGRKLDVLYRMAWYLGLKTTYYLRSLGATDTEKSTVSASRLNAVQATAASPAPKLEDEAGSRPAVCAIDEPDCEACQ